MSYDFTVIIRMAADDDIDAKRQAAEVLRAIALMGRAGVVSYEKLGLALERPDGSHVPLEPPEFPKGRLLS